MAQPSCCPRRTSGIAKRRASPPFNRWGRRRINLGAIVGALAVCCASAQTAGFLTERDILTILYNSCGGDDWVDNTNWLDDSVSVCTWYGISCRRVGVRSDSEDERTADRSVVAVELIENNLQCTLPPEIFYLPHLRTLDLGGNGGMDVDFTDIGKNAGFELAYLRLNDAGLTSLSGVERAAGINLKSLDVRGNDLTGDFPLEVFKYRRLKNLDLSYNFFSGTLPDDLGSNLVRMRTLLLSNNFFSGQIPNSVGSMTKMDMMDLSENGLAGTLPAGLGDLTRMTILSLRNQRIDSENFTGISGPLFDFAKLRRIDYLDLAGNNLSGTVPNTFLESADKMSPFLSVDMSKNNLVGTLPPSLSRFSVLRLYLIDNSIEDIAPVLCGQADWFFGEVGEFGCNAILCPRGTFNTWGRQISDNSPCEICPGGAPNYGSTNCQPPQIERAPPIDDSTSTQEKEKIESNTELVLATESNEETPSRSHIHEKISTYNLDIQYRGSNARPSGKATIYKPFAKEDVESVDIGPGMKSMPAAKNAGASMTYRCMYSGAIATLIVHALLHFF